MEGGQHGQKVFQGAGKGSFFGRFTCEQVVSRDHFLVKLNEVIDWDVFNGLLILAYKGMGKNGRLPYPPVVLPKMLLTCHLYNISERQVKEVTTHHLAINESVGLDITEAAPDHSILCDFKARLEACGGWGHLEAVGDTMMQQALATGVRLGKIQVVDSDADRRRQEQGQSPLDREARLVKGASVADGAGWQGDHQGGSVSGLRSSSQSGCPNYADH
jgi:hypothetical protein